MSRADQEIAGLGIDPERIKRLRKKGVAAVKIVAMIHLALDAAVATLTDAPPEPPGEGPVPPGELPKS